jgi:uncharacterized protein Veg
LTRWESTFQVRSHAPALELAACSANTRNKESKENKRGIEREVVDKKEEIGRKKERKKEGEVEERREEKRRRGRKKIVSILSDLRAKYPSLFSCTRAATRL